MRLSTQKALDVVALTQTVYGSTSLRLRPTPGEKGECLELVFSDFKGERLGSDNIRNNGPSFGALLGAPIWSHDLLGHRIAENMTFYRWLRIAAGYFLGVFADVFHCVCFARFTAGLLVLVGNIATLDLWLDWFGQDGFCENLACLNMRHSHSERVRFLQHKLYCFQSFPKKVVFRVLHRILAVLHVGVGRGGKEPHNIFTNLGRIALQFIAGSFAICDTGSRHVVAVNPKRKLYVGAVRARRQCVHIGWMVARAARGICG